MCYQMNNFSKFVTRANGYEKLSAKRIWKNEKRQKSNRVESKLHNFVNLVFSFIFRIVKSSVEFSFLCTERISGFFLANQYTSCAINIQYFHKHVIDGHDHLDIYY